jgi:hypothetical protein
VGSQLDILLPPLCGPVCRRSAPSDGAAGSPRIVNRASSSTEALVRPRLSAWPASERAHEPASVPEMATVPADRPHLERQACLLAGGRNAWHLVESMIAVGAGVAASSVALVAFGIDSLIEFAAAASVPDRGGCQREGPLDLGWPRVESRSPLIATVTFSPATRKRRRRSTK